jgi:hypothetical protein
MKKKKESIVVFEDWFRYARCLDNAEFRLFMSAILDYYKTQEQPQFTGLLLEVWNDIIDDLEKNVSTRLAKRDTMLKNSKSNSKLNTKSNIGPDTGSNIEPNTLPNTSGMVDGRLDMEDKILMINDNVNGKIKKIMKWEDDDDDNVSLHPNTSVSESLRLSGVSSIDEYWDI